MDCNKAKIIYETFYEAEENWGLLQTLAFRIILSQAQSFTDQTELTLFSTTPIHPRMFFLSSSLLIKY